MQMEVYILPQHTPGSTHFCGCTLANFDINMAKWEISLNHQAKSWSGSADMDVMLQ